MEQTQINSRIDKQLKAQGDAAFQLIGWSTSEVIRAVWSYAANHRFDLQELQQECEKLAGYNKTTSPENLEKLAIAKESWSIVDNTLASFGIDPSKITQTESDEEIYYRAMCERMEERGLV